MILRLMLSVLIVMNVSCSARFLWGKTYKRPEKGQAKTKWQALSFDQGPLSGINQGIPKQNPFGAVAKTCKLYNQFSTLAMFHVVRLDADLAQRLIEKKRDVRGLTESEYVTLLESQIEELSNAHVFYVLADVRGERYQKLHDKNAQWRLALQEQVDMQTVTPYKIIETDFDAETRLLFGDDWQAASAFKVAYKVEFPKTASAQEFKQCSLMISSPLVQDKIVWQA